MAEQTEPDLKDINVPDAKPGRGTFDLGDFIQAKSTVPVVSATVYLDADGGVQLQTAIDRLEQVKDEIEALEGEPKVKLGMAEADPKVAQLDKLNGERATLKETIDGLKARVLGSALYVEFQLNDLKLPSKANKLAAESVEADEEVEEDMKEAVAHDRGLSFLMAGLCVRITNSKGETIKAPFMWGQFQELRDKLIITESVKLVEAMNQTLMIGNEWTSHIDAGFPGRDSDVAR